MSSSPGHGHHLGPTALVSVGLGGAVGALLRWGVEVLVPLGQGWPWSTLLVNVAGSAALAWLVVHTDRRAHPPWLRPGVGTGLLGGFTTFSTYAVQVAVVGADRPVLAGLYLVLTPLLCVAAAALAGGAATRRDDR
ncbi:fluoride efflux transporter FluC [Serinicoccus kebangsaanensis]|uniref:fluoride efflux transporter FluC n=1 Tax=Serinicoccus kebangsaanensis TaxID=2602069 RepID=UPI00124D637B|nr:CrcB family protein [Serinicoccus kebangsaanensis]